MYKTQLTLREAPLKKVAGSTRELPKWGGGGLNAFQDGFGQPYIGVKMREEVP